MRGVVGHAFVKAIIELLFLFFSPPPSVVVGATLFSRGRTPSSFLFFPREFLSFGTFSFSFW
jgi:hypothetical protein